MFLFLSLFTVLLVTCVPIEAGGPLPGRVPGVGHRNARVKNVPTAGMHGRGRRGAAVEGPSRNVRQGAGEDPLQRLGKFSVEIWFLLFFR